MGISNSVITGSHFLHYFKPDDNKIYLFDCKKEKFYNFPMFKDNLPFFPGALQTISIPGDKSIFFIGGWGFKKTPNFKYVEELKLEEKDYDEDENSFELENKNFKNINPKDNFYAKTNDSIGEMIPLNFVGKIDLSKYSERLFVDDENFEQMEDARTSHSLVYSYPFIYVIGGVINDIPNQTCRRFHIKNKVWSDIASIGFFQTLTNPATIAYNDHIYVFDSYSEVQMIHKYNINYDIWENIQYKTNGFKIPQSLNNTIFRIDTSSLLLLNGIQDNKDYECVYYIYDVERDCFIQERYDKKLNETIKDFQGNLDYSGENKIFAQLSDDKIKVFYRDIYYWDNINVYQMSISKTGGNYNNASCMGKRDQN